MVQSLKKTAGMLVSACSGYAADGIKKVGVYSDSSSAVLGVSNLFVPDGKIEFLTAKARKVAHWRDDIAFVRHLPIWFAGIPGHENCLSDFLSHVHDELMARALKQKSEKQPRASGSVMLMEGVFTGSVVKGQDAKDGDDSVVVPHGFKPVKMLLSDDEWAELCAKYKDSKTEILEVSIGVIYRVLVMKDDTVSKVETKKVLGWKNKIFPVEVGDGEVALFVRAPLQDADLIDWEEEGLEQLDNVLCPLVVLVPEGVMVRVTDAPLLPEEEDAESYRFRDLRNDLFVMAHEFQLHAKVGMMYMFVTARAWWPGMKEMIKRHIKWCGLCAAKIKSSRVSGHGQVSVHSYRHVGADHVILPDWLVDLVGAAAVLVFSDKASGKIAASLVDTIDAEDTGIALFIDWIQHNGLMRTFTTDQGSAFTSKVFEKNRRVHGCKVHNFTSVGDSVALGDTENENRWIQKVISEAGAKGDVKDARTFKVYLAKSVVDRNQVVKTAGSTVFQRIHGFEALTVGNIFEDVEELEEECGCDFKGYQDTVLPTLMERSRELIASFQAHNNERNYLASYDRDTEVQFKKKQEIKFVKGDAVTWINKNKNPESGVVVAVRYQGAVPMSAVVETAGGGQRKKIQYNHLKEKSARRPQLLIGDAVRLEVGSIGFWKDEEGQLVGARILGLIEDQLLVHYYMENHNLRKWLPLWTLIGTEMNYRKEKCPDGCTAAEEVVAATMIEMTGNLKGTGFIEEDTLLRLQAWL